MNLEKSLFFFYLIIAKILTLFNGGSQASSVQSRVNVFLPINTLTIAFDSNIIEAGVLSIQNQTSDIGSRIEAIVYCKLQNVKSLNCKCR